MKSPLILLAIVLSAVQLTAQSNVYHEFPDSNATWNIAATGCCWADCGGPPTPNPVVSDYWFSHYIEGDTVINTITYRKLYKSGSEHQHCAVGPAGTWYYYDNYHLAFREDTALRKVYAINPSSTIEYVLYDFSAGVGDTVCPYDPCTVVTSIDSILIGSSYRKRFNIDLSSPYFIIEGIGSTAGVMEPACPFEYSATLVCFTQESQTLYPDTVTTCDLITDMASVKGPGLSLTVAPNPMTENGVVLIDRILHNASIVVMSVTGQVVLQISNANGNAIPFSGHGLANGVYVLQVLENNCVMGSMKIVVAE